VGEGRCRLHGGCSLRGRPHPNFGGGKYARNLDPDEQVQFEEFMAEFNVLAGIEDELKIGLFRGYQALVAGAKIPINVGGKLVYVEPDPKYILQCMDLATRAIERHRKLSQGTKMVVEFEDEQLESFLRDLGRVVARHVSNPAELAAIKADIEAMQDGCESQRERDGDDAAGAPV